MEIKREPLGAIRATSASASSQARDMLRGDLEDEELERYVEERVMTTTVDKAVAWARGNSFFPLTFGLACCAIEQIHIVASRMDIARFGWEAFRASPRQADLIILSGRVSIKMAPVDPADLRPDARAQVGDLDGRLLLLDGRVQQLRARARRTSSCRSTSTSPAARRGPRRSRTGSSSCAPRCRAIRRRRLARALRRGRHRGGAPGGATGQRRHQRVRARRHGRCLTRRSSS